MGKNKKAVPPTGKGTKKAVPPTGKVADKAVQTTKEDGKKTVPPKKEEDIKAIPVTEEEADDIRVTLSLDDGDVECKILTIFEWEDKDYIALVPLDEYDQAKKPYDIYLYAYHEDRNGDPFIDNIMDEDEYQAVVERFDELIEEELL